MKDSRAHSDPDKNVRGPQPHTLQQVQETRSALLNVTHRVRVSIRVRQFRVIKLVCGDL